MADRPLFTNEAALRGSQVIANSIANSAASPPTVGAVRLFDNSLVPDEGTTRADLVAAELVGASYPVGGYDITGFDTAKFAPGGGAVNTAVDLIDVAYTSGPTLICGGYWIDDSTPVTPKVAEVFIYDPPRTLGVVGDGWQIPIQLGYGANGI